MIILTLTAIPCIDEPQDNTLQKVELSGTTNNLPGDTDQCSPFCTCQCCQTNFCISKITPFYAIVELEVRYNEYSPAFQSLDLFDFYIPPKA